MTTQGRSGLPIARHHMVGTWRILLARMTAVTRSRYDVLDHDNIPSKPYYRHVSGSMCAKFQTKDNQIPFKGFVHGPIAPRCVQAARASRRKSLRLPSSTTLDKAVLSNHLTKGELFVENNKQRSYRNKHSMVYA